MIWHAGHSGDAGGMIYVIYDGGNWQEYQDRFVEGQMEKKGYDPPSGMLEPIRGFGKVWRESLGGPQASIGWALSRERASQVKVQPFTGTGVIISCEIGTYFLPHGHRWNQ
jgi:hypothetical protein